MKTYHITPKVLQGSRCEVRRTLRGKEVWEPGYCHKVQAYLRTLLHECQDEVGMTYGVVLDRMTKGQRPARVFVEVVRNANIRPEGANL